MAAKPKPDRPRDVPPENVDFRLLWRQTLDETIRYTNAPPDLIRVLLWICETQRGWVVADPAAGIHEQDLEALSAYGAVFSKVRQRRKYYYPRIAEPNRGCA